jgi:hypothetical protein
MNNVDLNNNKNYAQIPYDLVKEMVLAIVGVGVLVVILAAVLSTPDVPALSAKQVVTQDPKLLVQTALNDLAHQDAISTYGPPYSHTAGQAQKLGPFSPQAWAGVTLPVDSAKVDVIKPLQVISAIDPSLTKTLNQWNRASAAQQATWVQRVQKALAKGKVTSYRLVLPSSVKYGPVPRMLDTYLALARTGLLESSIDGMNGPMPITNRTDSLLLLEDQADGQYADKLDMTGDEWGIIKETGNYPGAVWLWYYTMLYQVPPFNNSASADLLVVLTVLLVTLLLMFAPFIPGLRSLPRKLKVYRLIWRNYYQESSRRAAHEESNES